MAAAASSISYQSVYSSSCEDVKPVKPNVKTIFLRKYTDVVASIGEAYRQERTNRLHSSYAATLAIAKRNIAIFVEYIQSVPQYPQKDIARTKKLMDICTRYLNKNKAEQAYKLLPPIAGCEP